MADHDGSGLLSKKEYLEQTCHVLSGFIQPAVLRGSLVAAATRMGVDPAVVDAVLATAVGGGVTEEAGKGKGKKKGDGEKGKRAGKLNTYTLFVTWFLDYCGHYGKNPRLQELKKENPEKSKVQLAASLYSSMDDDKKKQLIEAYKEFLESYNAAHMGQPGGTKANEGKVLDELAKFEATMLPEKPTFLRVMRLTKKTDYATDPAAMKAEAAAAKAAHAIAGATPKSAAAAAAAPVAAPLREETSEESDDDDEPAAKSSSDDDEENSSDDAPAGGSDDDDDDDDEEEEEKPPPKPVAPPPVAEKKRKSDKTDSEVTAPPSSKKSKHAEAAKKAEVEVKKEKKHKDKEHKKEKKHKE